MEARVGDDDLGPGPSVQPSAAGLLSAGRPPLAGRVPGHHRSVIDRFADRRSTSRSALFEGMLAVRCQ